MVTGSLLLSLLPAALAQDGSYGCELDNRSCRRDCSRSSSSVALSERAEVLRACLSNCSAELPLCKRQAAQGRQRGPSGPPLQAAVPGALEAGSPARTQSVADDGVDIRSLALQVRSSPRECLATTAFGSTLPSGRALMEPQSLAQAKQLRRQVLQSFQGQAADLRGLQAERDRIAARMEQRAAATQKAIDSRPPVQARVYRSMTEGENAADQARLVEIDQRLAARRNVPIRPEERQAVARHFELMSRLHLEAATAISDEASGNVLLFVSLRDVMRRHLLACLLGPMPAWGAGALQAPWDEAEARLDQLGPEVYARGRVALRDALRRVDDERVLNQLEIGLRAAEPIRSLVRQDDELQRLIDQQRGRLIAEREARERPIREAEAAERRRLAQEVDRQRLAAVERAARKLAPEPVDIQIAWVNEIVAAYPFAQPYNERAATVYALPEQTLEVYTLWLTVSSARCNAQGGGAYRCDVLATFNRTSRNPLTAWASAWVPDIAVNRELELVWQGTQLRSPTLAGMLTAMRGTPGGGARSSAGDGIPSMDFGALDDLRQSALDEKKELRDRRDWEEKNDTRNRSR